MDKNRLRRKSEAPEGDKTYDSTLGPPTTESKFPFKAATQTKLWRGSIYKLVWLDLLVFLLFYYVLNFTYRVLLEEDQKRIFEGIVLYCRSYVTVIPIAFVLGFYVTVVMNRWWSQYTSIPKPDSIAVFISTNIHGQDERGRVMRRTIMRYVCLCATMVLTMISPKVKKRFPTIEHLVEAGLLLENELHIIETMNKKFPKHAKHWMPIVWAAGIVTRARKEGRVRDDFAVKTIIDELNKFRGQCGLLISYDNISVPLVYTQVVTIAVYSYFLTSAMGRQWTEVNMQSQTYVANVDIYFPIFTTLEFFFYMGWLKVAESLINPFGDDDDDFEVSWMIDRNLQVSYLIVDEMHHEHPELLKDQYWDDVYPAELPYTMATEGQREKAPEPSTAKIDVPVRQQGIVTNSPSVIKIDEMHKQNDNQTVSYKFAPPENQEQSNQALSGVHVTADGRMVQNSNLNSISRVSSVASIMKRIFTKDDQNQNQPLTPPVSQSDGNSPFALSTSNASLGGKVPFGSKKLATDVIEEVDEQNTITSNTTKKQENRPTVDEVFATGAPASSQPIQIPNKRTIVDSQKGEIISSSAPSRWSRLSLLPVNNTGGDSISLQPQITYDSSFDTRPRLDSDIGPCLSAAVSRTMENETETDELLGDGDEFEKLKSIREKERRSRYLQKMLARSISGQQNAAGDNLDNDLLLKELVSHSQSQTEQGINKDSENKTAS